MVPTPKARPGDKKNDLQFSIDLDTSDPNCSITFVTLIHTCLAEVVKKALPGI